VRSRNGSFDGFVERNMLENKFQILEGRLAPALRDVVQLTLHPRHLSDQELMDTYDAVTQLLINPVTRHPGLLNPFRRLTGEAVTIPEAKGIFGQHVEEEMTRREYSGEIEATIELAIENLVAFYVAEETPRGFLNAVLKDSLLLLVRASVGVGTQFITSSAPFAFSWQNDDDKYPELAYMPPSKDAVTILPADGTRRLIFKRLPAREVVLWNGSLLNSNAVWAIVLAGDKTMLRLAVRKYESTLASSY